MFSSLLYLLIIVHLNFLYLDSGYSHSLVENVNVTNFSKGLKWPEISENRTNEWMISGGTIVDINEYPWQVSLEIDVPEHVLGSYVFIRRCSGTIIGPYAVLTAARCVVKCEQKACADPVEPGQIYLRYGSNYRDKDGSNNAVKSVKVNPEYTEYINKSIDPGNQGVDGRYKNVPHDIAVIVTTDILIFSERAQKIDYITPGDSSKLESLLLNEKACKIPGWGITKQHGKYSNRLEIHETNLISGSKCLDKLAVTGEVIEQEYQLCTYSSGNTPCKGDEGGALICTGVDGFDSIVAVYSWSQHCGVQVPSVYTRLDKKTSWISYAAKGSQQQPHEAKNVKSIARLLVPRLGLIFEALFLEIIALKNYLY